MNELQGISKKIFNLPGRPLFMLDRDVARLYDTKTKNLNRAVKRNPERFPEDFCFQLTAKEADNVVPDWNQFNTEESFKVPDWNLKTDNRGKHFKYLPYAFTREGCNMLSAVLNTPVAIRRSVQIMRAFSAMERYFTEGDGAADMVRENSPDSPLIPNGWQLHELRLIYGREGCKAILRDVYGIDPFSPKKGISYYESLVVYKENPDKIERNRVISELRDRGVSATEVARASGLSQMSVGKIHKRYGGRGQRYPWKDPNLVN